MKVVQDDNDEELQLQEEILWEHFQHIFGLQKHDLSNDEQYKSVKMNPK